jgi:ferredoxin
MSWFTNIEFFCITVKNFSNKKAKAAPGASLKDVAKKAGFSPNYGCEEGKCGSCELKVNGKTKIRPCIGKVPNAPSPIKFENL